MVRLTGTRSEDGILTGSALAAWALAAVLGVWGPDSVAATFVGAGVFLLLVRVFHRRMRGRTSMGPNKMETDLAPSDVAVRGSAPAPPPQASQPELDPSTLDPSRLFARWPTLEAALESIPWDWTQERKIHEDGHEYVHVCSPQSGYDLVINSAALDSAAPSWLMVAISVMESS